jgi:hypothetical protein
VYAQAGVYAQGRTKERAREREKREEEKLLHESGKMVKRYISLLLKHDRKRCVSFLFISFKAG